MNRVKNLGKAMWRESVKRIPYVILVFVVLGAFGAYQSYRKTAEGVEISKQNTADIKSILQSQTDLLNAIKQVTTDNNMTAKQQTDIIICMLQVPISERTTDTVTNCRKQAEVVEADTQTSQPSSAPNTTAGNSSRQPGRPTEVPRSNVAERAVNNIMKFIKGAF